MKKIALFSLLVCLCGIYVLPALAGSCEQRTVEKFSVIGGEWNTSNDYLYVSEGHFNSRLAYACETNGDLKNCSHGAKIAVSGSHYKGDVHQLNFGLWQCYTESGRFDKDDAWEAFEVTELSECNQDQLKTYEKILMVNDGVDIYCGNVQGKGTGSNRWCVNDMCRYKPCANCNDDNKPLIGENCQQWANKPDLYKCCMDSLKADAVVTFNNGICECKDKETKKWNPQTGKCEDTQRTKTCKESRTTAEGKACCDLPESEAKWDGKNCKCLDANATFKIDANGRGKCETNQSPVDNTPGNCWYRFRADMQCANGNSYVGEKKYLLTESDLNGQTCETFLKLYQNDATKMLELFNKFCNSQGSLQVINITPVGPNAAEVSNAKDTLNKFFANAESEASVWKDSEGKFNTARLASDLTAGVVLGTVGGVVSGVVIKKKQVEKGFEVLHCAVGGQKIADWGDEFSVGLQR